MRFDLLSLATTVLLLPAMCGCQTAPRYSSVARPGLRVIHFRDVEKRNQLPSQTQFSSADTIAVCAHGFAGRTITLELWEQNRGLLKQWSQAVAPPRTTRTQMGIMYHEEFGQMRPMRTERTETLEEDWVLRFERLPPGNYEVRLTSNAGHQDRATFTVIR